MTNVFRYARGHLFCLYRKRSKIEEKIAKHFGFTEEEFKKLDLCIERVNAITEYAQKRNCALYIDAEQTYL